MAATDSIGWSVRGVLGGLMMGLVEGLYPALCPLCRAPSDGACLAGACEEHRLPAPSERLPGPRCDRCAQALPAMLPDGTRCASCRRRPPRTVRVVALGDYREQHALRAWLMAFKHGGRRELAAPLGHALGARLLDRLGPKVSSSLLVPVPLHPLRRLERGYDQAGDLADAVASHTGAKVLRVLARTRWTPPQGAAGSPARSANVFGAFSLRGSRQLDLRGLTIWLVDDVVTSGATTQACAGVLTAQGARRIGVLTLARAGETPGLA